MSDDLIERLKQRAERSVSWSQSEDLMSAATRIEQDAATIAALRAERDAFKQTMYDEMDANHRLRERGGALPDEDMPTFLERVFAERDEARAELEGVRKDAERWLRVWECVRIGQFGEFVLMPDDPTGLAEDSIARAKFVREVDAAIDAARK